MYTFINRPIAVHLVRRRTVGVPIGWHLGAAFEYEEPTCLLVVELQRNGLHALTLRDFANNRTVEYLRTIQHPQLVYASIRRLNYLIDRFEIMRYDPLLQNCEHIARFIVEGRRQSLQVQTVVGLGILAGVVAISNRCG